MVLKAILLAMQHSVNLTVYTIIFTDNSINLFYSRYLDLF